MAYKVGERPGKGRYACTNCNLDIYLEDDKDTLPPCARCEAGEFKKVKDLNNTPHFSSII